MESRILSDIITICGLALGVSYFCNRFGIPAIVGFLLTGVISGPHGLRLLNEIHVVEQFAEVGVVCLLFTIGLEFSIDSLLQIKTIALVGGAVQVLATMFACMWLGAIFGLEYNQAIFFGLLVSLSSTAIVLQILQRTGDITSPHGRMSLGILIFQDIAVIPMTLLVPLLAGGAGGTTSMIVMLAIKVVGVFVIVLAAAKWFVPNALYQVAKFKDRELFFLGVVFIGLGVAWITSETGLSLALGAFLAGLIISESDYGH
ncbi:MAG: cation:proton antiporter, partial [Desulfomonilaceae bacterium]